KVAINKNTTMNKPEDIFSELIQILKDYLIVCNKLGVRFVDRNGVEKLEKRLKDREKIASAQDLEAMVLSGHVEFLETVNLERSSIEKTLHTLAESHHDAFKAYSNVV